ncbi:hypothetical protein [Absidia glauca]|uniref:MULE transposase domain-containing protein n=1 Tax=Absidia glauca TaxID=4829 RepID=A0A168PU34_ABSGL|nr:hypothetical protein [Absidia glauca]
MNTATPDGRRIHPDGRVWCKGCKTWRSSDLFVGVHESFRTCDVCRFRQTEEVTPPRTLIMLSELPHYFLDPKEVDDGVYLTADIYLDQRLRDMSNEQILQVILDKVQLLDHYEYYWKYSGKTQLRHCEGFAAVCSQDKEVAHHVDVSVLRRRYQRMESFACKGKVYGFINRKYNWVNLNVVHLLDHERPEVLEATMIRATPMPQAIKSFICAQIDIHDLNAVNLYEKVVDEFGYVVNRGQVSNAWRNAFVDSYKKHEDQLLSSQLLVRSLFQDSDCEELMFRSTADVKYFGFKTGFFNILTRSNQVTEYHVDSTYKTNRAGFELFGVVANVYGSGYPIAYLIVKVDTSATPSRLNNDVVQDTPRVAALKTFFQVMKDQGFNPTFMFTDKDQAEINAIEAIWPLEASSIIRLCLWHLKRAVKLKLSKAKTAILPIYDPNHAHDEYGCGFVINGCYGRQTLVCMNSLVSKPMSGLGFIQGKYKPFVMELESVSQFLYLLTLFPWVVSQLFRYIPLDFLYNKKHSFTILNFVPVVDARRRARRLLTTVDQRENILEKMGKHYNMHHMIPEGTTFYASNEDIRLHSAKDMYDYCYENGLQDTWAYLYRNWYTKTSYDRWAKSGVDGKLPIGKTTMMIEAHWKVLKRTHLYHYNRARLDLVTFVIIQHYYKKLRTKYQSIVVNRLETSTFESSFMKEWIKGRAAGVSGRSYATSLTRWICGCPSFLHSPTINPNPYHPGEHPREGLLPRPPLRRRAAHFDDAANAPNHPRRRTDQTQPVFTIPELVIPPRRVPTTANERTTPVVVLDDNDDGDDGDDVVDDDNDDNNDNDEGTAPVVDDNDDDEGTAPAVDDDNDDDEETAPVVDDEGRLLRRELDYEASRAETRRLEELLARARQAEAEARNSYVDLLETVNPQQAAAFSHAEDSNNVDVYLSTTIRERRRTTLPRTWRDYNPYTRSI